MSVCLSVHMNKRISEGVRSRNTKLGMKTSDQICFKFCMPHQFDRKNKMCFFCWFANRQNRQQHNTLRLSRTYLHTYAQSYMNWYLIYTCIPNTYALIKLTQCVFDIVLCIFTKFGGNLWKTVSYRYHRNVRLGINTKYGRFIG